MLRRLIRKYCGLICLASVWTIVYTSYLQYELEHNGRDLLHWLLYIELTWARLQYFNVLLAVSSLLFVGLLVAIWRRMNRRSFRWYDDLTDHEIRLYYANFLVIRLMTEIDTIDSKYLKDQRLECEDNMIAAHHEMFEVVETFRNGARRLLVPNEFEMALPIEEVYGIMDDEDRGLRRSRFYNTPLEIDEAFIRSLALLKILQSGASCNIYMFFGGTNFGFTAGANDFYFSGYTPDITSYDYDAVMDESGNITKKYQELSKVIREVTGVPANESYIKVAPRIQPAPVQLKPIAALLNPRVLKLLQYSVPVTSAKPLSFEDLNQYSGLVLYETKMPRFVMDPTLLTVTGLRDRAFVFVDGLLVGTLSRQNAINSLPLHKGWGEKLQILVENQGRINFNVANDTKGIDHVSIQIPDGMPKVLSNWTATALPMDHGPLEQVVQLAQAGSITCPAGECHTEVLRNGPVLFHGEFRVESLGDTYLNTSGWGKGVAYVNGFNLGRYWPLAGPQVTMYVPREILQEGVNSLMVLEYQRVKRVAAAGNSTTPTMCFENAPQLDG